MRLLNPEKLSQLQKEPKNIRNICIVAHVDHGKTTLADSLVASNGIISPRMAGKLRYMDSRKDEQERGITMKSSSITLYHVCEGQEFLVNLIDSPGHVDFSSEVSTAIRLCDGAVVVVDVVEGVCPQTQVALRQAWQESIKPVLVLNKIDRLIMEMKLTPLDAYIHMTQVLEQVNAIVGQLFSRDVLEKASKEANSNENNKEGVYDWGDGLEESDDSTLYFSPDQGNVIFASAIDGWGFCINDFVKLYSTKLGLRETVLRKTLWGNYFYNPKTKTVKKGAQEKAKKPLFVQLVLENIWAMYETICARKDKEKMMKMIEALGVKVLARDLRHSDPKVQLQAVCSQWLPVSKGVLDMVCNILPSANQLSEEKVEKLMCSNNQTFESYPLETQKLKKAFVECSSDESTPVIVFVSKMFPVERKILPQNRPAVLTPEELAERREVVKQRLAARQAEANAEGLPGPISYPGSASSSSRENSADSSSNELNSGPNYPNSGPEVQTQETPPLSEDVFIAFARVYSGALRKGCTVYVLGPKHDPAAALSYVQEEGDISEELTLKDLKAGRHATKAKIEDIYMMMGRELETVPEAYAGNVVGIGGLEEHVLKSATLSSELACPSFCELNLMAVPILRVAVEAVRPADMPNLVRGLKLLNQADACVQVIVQESGEHVLVTAGEVHLERCIDDLKTRYAKVDVTVSEPIIPFRETVVPPPKVDMVNEAIEQAKKPSQDDNTNNLITMYTPNKQSVIQILCAPLPPAVTEILDKNAKLLKVWDTFTAKKSGFLVENLADLTIKSAENISETKSGASTKDAKVESAVPEKLISELVNFKEELKGALKDCEGIWCPEIIEHIWSFGPRRCGPNILVNQIDGFEERNVWRNSDLDDAKMEYDSSFVNGFQMASLAGPLCEEPMMGVAFFVRKWEIFDSVGNPGSFGPFSGQIMSTVKEACRKSFQAQPQRLMAAMYTCNIQANQEVLGKMYAVLGRRHGRILAGDMTQGSATFTVTAVLPVVESFNFAAEIRKQTSGLAQPQLVFSHWEVIEIDPFWSPYTEEEYLHYGEKADTENKARQYMNSVRRRKGLTVEEKIVQHAEKQRTLGRNK